MITRWRKNLWLIIAYVNDNGIRFRTKVQSIAMVPSMHSSEILFLQYPCRFTNQKGSQDIWNTICRTIIPIFCLFPLQFSKDYTSTYSGITNFLLCYDIFVFKLCSAIISSSIGHHVHVCPLEIQMPQGYYTRLERCPTPRKTCRWSEKPEH